MKKKVVKMQRTNNIFQTFFPRKAPVPWWSGLPAHHVPVFALLGGEQPLLPLTLPAGFSCVQLEWQFEPTSKFSPSLPRPISHSNSPLHCPYLCPDLMVCHQAVLANLPLGMQFSPADGGMLFFHHHHHSGASKLLGTEEHHGTTPSSL